MADLGLTLSLGGDVQLNRTLVGIARNIGDMRPAWNVIADDLMAANKKQFDSEGAHGGTIWKPLADTTQAQRTLLGVGASHPILDRTGAGSYDGRVGGQLMRSVTVKGAANQVLVIDPHQFQFGTTDEVAGYHQRGGRPILELPEQLRRAFMKTLQRFVVTGRLA